MNLFLSKAQQHFCQLSLSLSLISTLSLTPISFLFFTCFYLMAWTVEENKRFEKALSKYDKDTPDRWEKVAAMVGSGKTVQDVKSHYKLLLDDVERIESGNIPFPNYCYSSH